MRGLGHFNDLSGFVDRRHSGYGCRGGCVSYFGKSELRDAHEELVHRYIYVAPAEPRRFGFNPTAGKRKATR